jgi:hypothetical protein
MSSRKTVAYRIISSARAGFRQYPAMTSRRPLQRPFLYLNCVVFDDMPALNWFHWQNV